MKDQINSNKAITLIVLVIIIVAVLVFAGVGIFMIIGENGILAQEQDENNSNKESEIEKSEENEALPKYAGKRYNEEINITIEKVPVTIPGGATISGISGECESVDDGIVIYIIPEETDITDWEADSDGNGIIDVQEKYDQFVWIPVPNVIVEDMNNDGTVDGIDINEMIARKRYPMAITSETTTDVDGNTITNYRGILYDFSLKDRKVDVSYKDYSLTAAFKEPVYLTDASYADKSSYNNVEITENSLQSEFNTMVERVNKNKGFWVGRYETSNMVSDNTQDTTNKIGIIKGTTTGINNVNWYRMYVQQKNYSNLVKISSTSSMIWGSQWDQIMIRMKNIKNNKNTVTTNSYYVINAIGMGNFGVNANGTIKTTKEIEATGSSEDYKVKNIYDLAGNVYDWTLEAIGADNRIARRRPFQ